MSAPVSTTPVARWGAPRSAVIVSAVPPQPAETGKRVVLSGMLDYLVERLGADHVHYALVHPVDEPLPELPCRVHRLDRPGSAQQVRSVLTRSLVGPRRHSLQESMLFSAELQRQLHALLRRLRPGLEIYDTLRLGQLVEHRPTSGRRVLYLDDLFSVRYSRMLGQLAGGGPAGFNPLGEFAQVVPAMARSAVGRPAVARALLRYERRLIAARETQAVHAFDVSLLVSPEEVAVLRSRSGDESVEVLTPLVDAVPPVARRAASPRFVFLGRLSLPHNEDAVRALIQHVLPALRRRLPESTVRIVGGGATPALAALIRDHSPAVVHDGYVEDLDAVLSAATALLAPLRFGSGIKIKMLEAFARGIPVVATTSATEGIPVTGDGAQGCLVADDLAAWPELLAGLVDPGRNDALSTAARAFYDATYSRDVVHAQYDQVFGLAATTSDASC